MLSDGKTAATYDQSKGFFYTFNARTGQTISAWQCGPDKTFSDISPDENRVAWSDDGGIRLINPITGESKFKDSTLTPCGALRAICFIDDGKTIAGNTGKNEPAKGFCFWNAKTGELIRSVETEKTMSYEMYFLDNKTRILTCDKKTSVPFVCDAQTDKMIQMFRAIKNNTRVRDVSADERECLTSCSDGSILLWDASTGEPLRAFPAFKSSSSEACFRRDPAAFNPSAGPTISERIREYLQKQE